MWTMSAKENRYPVKCSVPIEGIPNKVVCWPVNKAMKSDRYIYVVL